MRKRSMPQQSVKASLMRGLKRLTRAKYEKEVAELCVQLGYSIEYKGKVFSPNLNIFRTKKYFEGDLSPKTEERLNHFCYMYGEWDKIEHVIVYWFNQCKTVNDCYHLLPELAQENLLPVTHKTPPAPDTITEDFIESVRTSDEFAMLESLIFTHEIIEV